MRRAQKGERAACRELVTRYERPVFALLSRLFYPNRDRALVEDLAQETFLRLFRALPEFSLAGPARLSSFILTIATRLGIDELRRRRPPLVSLDAAATEPAAERADAASERRDQRAALERAIAELAPEYRATFLLREVHELDYADIGRALDIDVGTVKSRLSRAREKLRAALEENRP